MFPLIFAQLIQNLLYDNNPTKPFQIYIYFAEYICTEAATTIIPTVSPRNESMNSSSSSENNISVMLANNSPDKEQIVVKKSPKSMVLVITIAPIAFVIVLLTAVVIVTCGVLGVWTVKLR